MWIFDEHLATVERQKPSILMNHYHLHRPLLILELSKIFMYDFHYNFIKRIYPGDRTIFLFADMDFVMYYVKTKDLQKDMEFSSSKFDFSEYTQDDPLYSETNKKVLRKFKGELNGKAAYQYLESYIQKHTYRKLSINL